MFNNTKYSMPMRRVVRLARQARELLWPIWISASLLWRTYLANLILSVLLFGQQPARVPAQPVAAAPTASIHLHAAGFSKDYRFRSSER